MARGSRRGGHRGGSQNSPRFTAGRNPKRNLLLGLEQPTSFTLADEARSTAHAHATWSSDTRLRNRPVSFVSAGTVDPLKQLEEQLAQKAAQALSSLLPIGSAPSHQKAQDASSGPTQADSRSATGNMLKEPPASKEASATQGVNDLSLRDGEAEFAKHDENTTGSPIEEQISTVPARAQSGSTKLHDEPCARASEPVSAQEMTTAGKDASLFFVDTTGDRCHRGQMHVAPDVDGPDESDSSTEVILFKGRNQMRRLGKDSRPGPRARARAPAHPTTASSQDQHDRGGQKGPAIDATHAHLPDVSTLAIARPIAAKKQKSKKKNKTRKNREAPNGNLAIFESSGHGKEDDTDMINDYIANMREHGDDEGLLAEAGHSRRDIGGSDMDAVTAIAADPEAAAAGTDRDGGGEDKKHMDSESPREEACLDHLLALALQEASSDAESDDAQQNAVDADDYDFMDWGEPLTRRSRKSKGQVPAFNLSDSELEAKMQAAFKKDRLRKADRKREREQLREQGLLGSKTNPEDPRTKYQEGMSLEQISYELRVFLLSEQTSLTLPPMDNNARKVIHELANKFNIKSKSTGSGDQRRPTLYRTLRTFKYSEDAFEAAIARVGRKYFPRKDRMPLTGAGRQTRRGGGGGGGNAALSYRDGEVVGGSAPELGQENRGRAMLEKMGWSSGTALGTLSNKGILQPVEQKVKRGKAGLG